MISLRIACAPSTATDHVTRLGSIHVPWRRESVAGWCVRARCSPPIPCLMIYDSDLCIENPIWQPLGVAQPLTLPLDPASRSIATTSSFLGLRSRSPARRGRETMGKDEAELVPMNILGDARRPHGLPLAFRHTRSSRHSARGPQRDVRPVSTSFHQVLNSRDSRAESPTTSRH